MSDFWGENAGSQSAAGSQQPEWGTAPQQAASGGATMDWGSAGSGGHDWSSGAPVALPDDGAGLVTGDYAHNPGSPPQPEHQSSQHASGTGSPTHPADPFPLGGATSASVAASAAQSQQFNSTAKSTASSAAASRVLTADEATKEAEAEVLVRGKSKFEAEKKAMAQRTTDADQKNADGLYAMKQEAASFHKADQQKRESLITTAKKTHRDEQKAQADRAQSLQKGGHLWEQVGDLVDTAKPNKFAAKSTDRMRNLLMRLKATPNAKQMSVA